MYVCIWVFGFLVFRLYPFIGSLLYSFTNYDIFHAPELVGSDNYIKLFTKSREFWNLIVVILKYTFITASGKVVLTLIIAVILNRNLKGIDFIRTVYHIPSLLSSFATVAILWKMLFMNGGFINSFLDLIHIGPAKRLGTPDMTVITIYMPEIWQSGSSMVLLLFVLKQMPQSLYEAIWIDGASKPRMFFEITLPMITSIALFDVIMQLTTALQNFTSAFVVTSDGPNKATYVLRVKLYTDTFKYFKIRCVRTTSWALFMVILVMTIIPFATSKKRVYYDDQEDGMKEKEIKDGATCVILGIVGVMMLFPAMWMFFACFKTNNEMLGSLSLLLQRWSPEAFTKG